MPAKPNKLLKNLILNKNDDSNASRTARSDSPSSQSRLETAQTKNGDFGASRTHNLLLRTEPLYPLSYEANTNML